MFVFSKKVSLVLYFLGDFFVFEDAGYSFYYECQCGWYSTVGSNFLQNFRVIDLIYSAFELVEKSEDTLIFFQL